MISKNVRTGLDLDGDDGTQRAGFINNKGKIYSENAGGEIDSRQGLSEILKK
jgi:hypothetical protein